MVQAHTVKATILDGPALARAWRRIAHEVIERQPQLERLVLVGIVTRGVPLADRLGPHPQQTEGVAGPILAPDGPGFPGDVPPSTAAAPHVSPHPTHSTPSPLACHPPP